MNVIHLINKTNRHLFREQLCEMFEHRQATILGQLGWGSSIELGFGKDRFDTDESIYLLTVDKVTRELLASVRLNPTSRPTILSENLSFLCDYPIPLDDDTWEISHFSHNPELIFKGPKAAALKETICGILECSLLHGWHRLLFVGGAEFFSHWTGCGWEATRLGPSDSRTNELFEVYSINVKPVSLKAVRDYAGLGGPALMGRSDADYLPLRLAI